MATILSMNERRNRWEKVKRAGLYFALVVYVGVADWALLTLGISIYRLMAGK